MQLFCFGLGYVAQHLAAHLPHNRPVAGTTRTVESCLALQQKGLHAFCYDGTGPLCDAGKMALKAATHLLISIPPDADGSDAALHVMEKMLGSGHFQWLGYLSTTGVYGDHGGAWVNEETTPIPHDELGKRRLAAENNWKIWGAAHDVPVHIFRLSGIYGPKRNVLEQLLAGKCRRIDKPQHYFSRIHVADIAHVLQASMHQPVAHSDVYNVCDDAPSESRKPVEFAAELLGVKAPALVSHQEAGLSPMAQRFYTANRRVKNNKIKHELGVRLQYPTFREGLEALHHEMAE